MTKNDNPNRKSITIAAIAAGLVIIVFSAAYSVLATRLAAPVNTISLPTAALERLPLQIGGWMGQETPLDEEIVRATDTDAHISRIYSRHNAFEYISLYIAYGVRARDLMPHRPEVCYTGAGWTLIDKRSLKLPLSDEVDIHEPGKGASGRYGEGREGRTQGRGDDLIALSHIERHERQLQGVGAIGHANGKSGVAVARKVSLECGNILPQDEPALVEHRLDRSIQFDLDRLVLELEISKGNHGLDASRLGFRPL